ILISGVLFVLFVWYKKKHDWRKSIGAVDLLLLPPGTKMEVTEAIQVMIVHSSQLFNDFRQLLHHSELIAV
ncbi:MAG: hypothetical protein ACI90V_010249, partial [Bacillariaceae sp.]